MFKREQQAEMARLARAGALEQAKQLIKLFPDLLDDLNRLAPKRRLSSAMRAELHDATETANGSNGSTPPKKPGNFAGHKWSAAQKRKFKATMRKYWKEKKAARREAGA